MKSSCVQPVCVLLWPDCSWYLTRASSTKDSFTSKPERRERQWKRWIKRLLHQTITYGTLISTHLVSGTCVLQPPAICFWNEAEGLPGCDGNTADCGHEGSSAAAPPCRCEHLKKKHSIWTTCFWGLCRKLMEQHQHSYADVSQGRAALSSRESSSPSFKGLKTS